MIFFTLGKKNSGKCIFYFVNGQICRGGRVNKKTVESGFAFGCWLLALTLTLTLTMTLTLTVDCKSQTANRKPQTQHKLAKLHLQNFTI